MAQIITKPFDASKKIIRSEFKGSPNLMTTADLNRQLEAFKYELEMAGKSCCVVSDIEVTARIALDTLSVSFDYSYIECAGCSFSPEKKTLTMNMAIANSTVYLCLIAEKATVTYDDDSTHEIAGARFADGTSMPAANQIVYKNERLALYQNLSLAENLVAVLAVIEEDDNGNPVVWGNCIAKDDSVLVRMRREIFEKLSGMENAQWFDIFPTNGILFQRSVGYFSFDEKYFSLLKDGDILELVIPYLKTNNGYVFQMSVKIPIQISGDIMTATSGNVLTGGSVSDIRTVRASLTMGTVPTVLVMGLLSSDEGMDEIKGVHFIRTRLSSLQ